MHSELAFQQHQGAVSKYGIPVQPSMQIRWLPGIKPSESASASAFSVLAYSSILKAFTSKD